METPDGRPTGGSWEDGLEPILVRPAGRRPLSLRETLHREASPRGRRPSTPTMRFLCAAVWLLSGIGTATAAWSVRQTMFPPTEEPAPASVWQNASTSDEADHGGDPGPDVVEASPETRPIAVRPEDRYGHHDEDDDGSGSGSADDQPAGTPTTASDDRSGSSASSGSGSGPTTTVPEVDDSSGRGSGDDRDDDSGSSGSGRGGSGTDGSGTGAPTDNSGSGSGSSGSGSSGSGSDDEAP